MIGLDTSDDTLRELFTRKPAPAAAAEPVTGFMRPCEVCAGRGSVRDFYDGFLHPCTTCDGTGIYPEPDNADTQEIDVDALLALSAPYVQPDPQSEMNATLRWLEAQQPVPELPILMQAVSGFLSGLVWAIEDRTPIDRLSDDQREIIARVRQMVEQDAPEMKNAE